MQWSAVRPQGSCTSLRAFSEQAHACLEPEVAVETFPGVGEVWGTQRVLRRSAHRAQRQLLEAHVFQTCSYCNAHRDAPSLQCSDRNAKIVSYVKVLVALLCCGDTILAVSAVKDSARAHSAVYYLFMWRIYLQSFRLEVAKIICRLCRIFFLSGWKLKF